MESPSRGFMSSSPRRTTQQQDAATLTPRSSEGGGGKASKVFSRLFSQFKNLIAEVSTIEPTSDVAPGVDHCCKTSRCHYGLPVHHDSEMALNCASATSSSSKFSQVASRLIVYRDCDRRGRKILFDSEHVSEDYVYLKPSDPKLLKNLGEYVFGCVPLASASSTAMDFASAGHKRFCKWKLEDQSKTLHIWSKIFELGSLNRSKLQEQGTSPVDYSSSSSEHSTSGYESGSASSPSSTSGKTFSLPLINPRPSSRNSSQEAFPQTRSLPGRIDSYRTNLALVWMLSQNQNQQDSPTSESSSPDFKIPFLYLSPLVEKLLVNPLTSITKTFYHNSDHFVSSLKNVSTSLNYDLRDFLSNRHVVNLTLVKPPLTDMVNVKLVAKFLELIFRNKDSCVVLNMKKWTEVKAVLYFLKMFLKTCVCKCSLCDLQKEGLVETGTDVASTHELDGVDSGIELENSASRLRTISSSSVYGRKWSIVSEESELGSSLDEGCEGRVSFHLGDVDVDQSEAKLALGEVDLTRLKGGERRHSIESDSSSEIPPEDSGVRRPPVEVKLNFSESRLRDSCPVKYTPCYHCNGTYITETLRFNPFYFVQVMGKPGQVTYDMQYVSFMKIIELYGSGSTRSFNLTEVDGSSTAEDEAGGNELAKKIKDFVEAYVTLSRETNDSGKIDNFVTFQMEEIRDSL